MRRPRARSQNSKFDISIRDSWKLTGSENDCASDTRRTELGHSNVLPSGSHRITSSITVDWDNGQTYIITTKLRILVDPTTGCVIMGQTETAIDSRDKGDRKAVPPEGRSSSLISTQPVPSERLKSFHDHTRLRKSSEPIAPPVPANQSLMAHPLRELGSGRCAFTQSQDGRRLGARRFPYSMLPLKTNAGATPRIRRFGKHNLRPLPQIRHHIVGIFVGSSVD